MKIRLQGFIFFGCLLVAGGSHAMHYSYSTYSNKKVAQMWVAKATKSIEKQGRSSGSQGVITMVDPVNKQDYQGCTSLHRLMIDKQATIERVQLLIENGARLDITTKKGEDPYEYGVLYKGHSPYGELRDQCFYNRRIVNFIHSEILNHRLQSLIGYRHEIK